MRNRLRTGLDGAIRYGQARVLGSFLGLSVPPSSSSLEDYSCADRTASAPESRTLYVYNVPTLRGVQVVDTISIENQGA